MTLSWRRKQELQIVSCTLARQSPYARMHTHTHARSCNACLPRKQHLLPQPLSPSRARRHSSLAPTAPANDAVHAGPPWASAAITHPGQERLASLPRQPPRLVSRQHEAALRAQAARPPPPPRSLGLPQRQLVALHDESGGQRGGRLRGGFKGRGQEGAELLRCVGWSNEAATLVQGASLISSAQLMRLMPHSCRPTHRLDLVHLVQLLGGTKDLLPPAWAAGGRSVRPSSRSAGQRTRG